MPRTTHEIQSSYHLHVTGGESEHVKGTAGLKPSSVSRTRSPESSEAPPLWAATDKQVGGGMDTEVGRSPLEDVHQSPWRWAAEKACPFLQDTCYCSWKFLQRAHNLLPLLDKSNKDTSKPSLKCLLPDLENSSYWQ